jgi:hypothetical protein
MPGTSARTRRAHADSAAAASFVLGLVGLLVFSLVLGPAALVLGSMALFQGTAHRGRAVLGLLLGTADLVVLAVVTASDHSFVWSF